jgi:hypothetical protein
MQGIRDTQQQLRTFGTALSFYAEAFYYIAHRAVKTLQGVKGFSTFQVPEIRDVRNHLIEHPLTLARNFTHGDPALGFVLKPYRPRSIKTIPQDAGLYPNAERFVERLLPYVRRSGV